MRERETRGQTVHLSMDIRAALDIPKHAKMSKYLPEKFLLILDLDDVHLDETALNFLGRLAAESRESTGHFIAVVSNQQKRSDS